MMAMQPGSSKAHSLLHGYSSSKSQECYLFSLSYSLEGRMGSTCGILGTICDTIIADKGTVPLHTPPWPLPNWMFIISIPTRSFLSPR